MNRIRIGAQLTVILGVIWAAAGLMESLHSFGIGMAVAATGMLIHGCVDFIDAHNTTRAQQYRDQVWARRDQEARPRWDEAA